MIKNKLSHLGWPLVFALSFFPVLLWGLAPSLVLRFDSGLHFFTSLGQIFALSGTSMFALNFILGARLKFLEKYFDGQNRVYERHNQLGQIALIFLLFHPLFLLPKYAGGSFGGAALFLLPNSNLPQTLGWVALVMMILLIVLTLYLRPKYNMWKWTHKFFGLAFLLVTLHMYFIPSDVAVFLPLRIYMLGLSILGLIAFGYRSLLARFFVKNYIYIVTKVSRLTGGVIEIGMRSSGESIHFKPGQFVFVKFKNKKVGGEIHPFSFSSHPDEEIVAITVKCLGDYTNNLDALCLGDQALLEGPYGVFDFRRGFFKNQIWIAGGIGITPFLSMASELKLLNCFKIDLYYCLKNKNEAIYLDRLREMAPNLNLIEHYSDYQGRLDATVIIKKSGSLKNKSIYLCAPSSMIQSLKNQFRSMGVRPSFVYSEEFNFG